jgi:hypothetical protein
VEPLAIASWVPDLRALLRSSIFYHNAPWRFGKRQDIKDRDLADATLSPCKKELRIKGHVFDEICATCDRFWFDIPFEEIFPHIPYWRDFLLQHYPIPDRPSHKSSDLDATSSTADRWACFQTLPFLPEKAENTTLKDVFRWTLLAGYGHDPNPSSSDTRSHAKWKRQAEAGFKALVEEEWESQTIPSIAGASPFARDAPGRLSLPGIPRGMPWETAGYGYAVSQAMNGRKMFVTARGYIGIGDWNVMVGDTVAALYPQMYPYVLKDGGEGKYRIGGHCYVYGTMFGETFGMEGVEARYFDVI